MSHTVPVSGPLEAAFISKLDMDIKAAQVLGAQFSPVSLAAGDHWIKAGDRCRLMAFVMSGLFRVYYIDRDGRERNQHFYTPTEAFAPIASIMTNETVRFYVQALEPTVLMVADYDRLKTLELDYPDWTRLELATLQQVFVKNARHEAQLLLGDAAQKYRWFCKEYPELAERLPQYHIASFLGITPVSLSRLRKKTG